MQLFLVIIILISAFIYAAFKIYKALTDKSGACAGCPLNEACKKKKTKDI